mmetsp:Transcript_124022/g.396530  ORF Transcript_124022/g.396530 Transcript_124022/m.396530 type:complete len:502 (+) Transcript_124022:93-1598(+)|eukprot:CAMPEP_0204185054 /NCGR_PEP_ID=MMETSP0361-20130328/54963_1 /ASSEMBLY_ACC=CAM_ASM_000343 /TAXON_ID=268821 /ORGANISM="Scrippsiella Hangoei, Strain SHTV-5" /LENGTH=501 /DNA_ID=CAMNT_0051145181 /DNA_START=53 /DNA_END=1558 /DNA_ORIENTATION=+
MNDGQLQRRVEVAGTDEEPPFLARLQWHARRFAQESSASAIVARYAAVAEQWQPSTLLRHTAHVAAWVAFAPHEGCELTEVEALLKKLVDRLYVLSLSMPSRLRWALKHIHLHKDERQCCVTRRDDFDVASLIADVDVRVIDESNLGMADAALPSQACLRHVLGVAPTACDASCTRVSDDHMFSFDGIGPRRDVAAKRKLSPEMESRAPSPSTHLSSAITLERSCRFNRERHCWSTRDFTGRASRVARMESRIAVLVAHIGSMPSAVEARLLRSVMREAAAALAAPRARWQPSDNLTALDANSVMRLRATAALQKRVRAVLMRAIQAWRLSWADDEQIEPMLQHVRSLIGQFQGRSDVGVSEARAGPQWAELNRLVSVQGLAFKHGAPEENLTQSLGSKKRGALTALVKTILHRIGPSTTGEVITGIQKDAELWSTAQTYLTFRAFKDRKHATRSTPCWKKSVTSAIGKLADHGVLVDTGERRQGSLPQAGLLRVWMLAGQ